MYHTHLCAMTKQTEPNRTHHPNFQVGYDNNELLWFSFQEYMEITTVWICNSYYNTHPYTHMIHLLFLFWVATAMMVMVMGMATTTTTTTYENCRTKIDETAIKYDARVTLPYYLLSIYKIITETYWFSISIDVPTFKLFPNKNIISNECVFLLISFILSISYTHARSPLKMATGPLIWWKKRRISCTDDVLHNGKPTVNKWKTHSIENQKDKIKTRA